MRLQVASRNLNDSLNFANILFEYFMGPVNWSELLQLKLKLNLMEDVPVVAKWAAEL